MLMMMVMIGIPGNSSNTRKRVCVSRSWFDAVGPMTARLSRVPVVRFPLPPLPHEKGNWCEAKSPETTSTWNEEPERIWKEATVSGFNVKDDNEL